MRIFTLKEREQVVIPLDVVIRDGRIDILEDVRSGRFFELRLKPDGLALRAKGFVGFVPINRNAALEVTPKAPLVNVVRMLKVAGNTVTSLEQFERLYSHADDELPGLLRILGGALVRSLQLVEIEGLSKQYEERRFESLVGGRLDIAGSFRHWAIGARHRASVDAHDQTSDTSLNRVLRAACNRVIQHIAFLEKQESKLLKSLVEYDEFLADRGVSLVQPSELRFPDRHDIGPPYAAALAVARTILTQRGVELPAEGTDVPLPSLLIDMDTLFEDYVRAVLARSFKVLNGNTNGMRPLFDDVAEPPAKPDVVLLGSNSNAVAVLDAKYKANVGRDDLNQLIAYAVTYRVENVLVVAPQMDGEATSVELIGRIGLLRLLLVRVNLASVDAEAQERRLVEIVGAELAELTPQTSTAATDTAA